MFLCSILFDLIVNGFVLVVVVVVVICLFVLLFCFDCFQFYEDSKNSISFEMNLRYSSPVHLFTGRILARALFYNYSWPDFSIFQFCTGFRLKIK